ncbi:twin-arginine translocation signal domain-containing protein [Sphingobacterium sp. BIGb0165]|uniref:twin-arginine translocation signal domain-containing protein n=1 Tax=Sphingobacterium sp. BIGb0165 TaxID=2940615 RepID=UPI0038F783A9
MEKSNKQSSRREFLQHTALAGAGLMLAYPLSLFSQINHSPIMNRTSEKHRKAKTGNA